MSRGVNRECRLPFKKMWFLKEGEKEGDKLEGASIKWQKLNLLLH